MARYTDYKSDSEVKDIMEKFVDKFPQVFEGFRVDDICYIMTQKKKTRDKYPIKVHSIRYPFEALIGKPYIVEIFEEKWAPLSQKKKNLAVFRTMCAIPVGGFDPESKSYAKKVKPQYQVYGMEFAAAGGVLDWCEDDRARNPMEIDTEDVQVDSEDGEDPIPTPKSDKVPVTSEHIQNAVASVS